MNRQVLIHPQEKQGSITLNSYKNGITLNVPSSSFLELLLLSTMSYGMRYPLGQLGPAFQAALLLSSCAVPVYSLGQSEKQKDPDAVQELLSCSCTISVLSTVLGHKSKIYHAATMKKISSILAQTWTYIVCRVPLQEDRFAQIMCPKGIAFQ